MRDVSNPRNRRTRAKQTAESKNPLIGSTAVAVARAALVELDEGEVGEHVGVAGLSKNVATHRFAAHVPGYPGWEWNAVVACAEGSSWVTVNELALVPAPSGEALQAPEWVPYTQRLRPGDLGPGDVLPPAPDDERLTDSDTDPNAVFVAINAPREHYLTKKGLRDAKQRWRTGEHGPTSEFAEKAALRCSTCAFYVPFADPVGPSFGACTNLYSADGSVVHEAYGCGAHSDTPFTESVVDTPDAYDDERPLFS